MASVKRAVWADGAEAVLRQVKRNLGLGGDTVRVLRQFIERAAQRDGLTCITKTYAARKAAEWECGE